MQATARVAERPVHADRVQVDGSRSEGKQPLRGGLAGQATDGPTSNGH
ncbi:hypothetical protein [Streptomyces spectabilis]|uniref:Uncharacterized protein n=1 Tax=Streptomyces spectabilis TaxID=68270 RepID=A0A7W8ARJ0_STRST|nr:hypothetical protein [Streptomyces spectabilis]